MYFLFPGENPQSSGKRGRLLIRQPHVKKESDPLHAQYSTPECALDREGFQVRE